MLLSSKKRLRKWVRKKKNEGKVDEGEIANQI